MFLFARGTINKEQKAFKICLRRICMLEFMKVKKIMAVVLSASLMVAFAACGKTETSESPDSIANTTAVSPSSTSTEKTPITLKMWNSEVLTPGIQNNEIANEIARLTGITMDIIQGDAQKFKILVAGNDLPDIIYTNPAQQQVDPGNLISSKQIIAMDELIEEYGTNIKKNFSKNIEYSKKFLSGGQDKVYWLPVQSYRGNPEAPTVSNTISDVGIMVRWDIYAKIGYPEIKTTDDFLNVLKQMQDAAKDMAGGKKVYAISGWSDWGIWPWWISNTREMGYTDLPNNVMFNNNTGENSIIYTNEDFWESISFYNKAYRMGILDPEAFTMKSDQFLDKLKKGQALMGYASWQTDYINMDFVSLGHPDWGFEKLPHNGYPYISGIVSPEYPLGNGQDYANAITTNCKNPERAIQFIDFMNSTEGARLVYSGVKGKHWDEVDGKPQPTEEFLNGIKNDSDYRNKVGTAIYNKFCAMRDIQVIDDKFPADLMKSDEQKAKNVLPIDKEYCKYFGDYDYPGQVLLDLNKQGKVQTFNKYWLFPSLVQQPSDDTKKIMSQINEYMKVQIAKIIMSKSDADFEEQKAKAIKDIKAKGYEKAEADILEKYNTAKEAAGSFQID